MESPQVAKKKILTGIRSYFRKSGFKRAVLGLSGGVDSALTCVLLSEALGPKSVFVYHLPNGKADKSAENDARLIAHIPGVNFKKIEIGNAVSAISKTAGAKNRVSRGNIAARVRMILLYNFAREKNALVVGTGNRTEFLLGYFTKYGDGAADIFPIGSLYKSEVRRLAAFCGIPLKIVQKAPTAGLWNGQTDEEEIGAKYSEMDFVLHSHFDLNKSEKEIAKKICANKSKAILERVKKNRHKSLPAPII